MSSYVCVKHHGCLYPADEWAAEALARIRDNDHVLVEMKRLRNPRFHRLFFAMLNMIYENQTRYRSLDQLLDAIKVYVGHVRTIRWHDGREVMIPKSISWAKMDENSFRAFYDRVVDVVVAEIIPNVKREDLARQLKEITGT